MDEKKELIRTNEEPISGGINLGKMAQHVEFTPKQARQLAALLIKHADTLDRPKFNQDCN